MDRQNCYYAPANRRSSTRMTGSVRATTSNSLVMCTNSIDKLPEISPQKNQFIGKTSLHIPKPSLCLVPAFPDSPQRAQHQMTSSIQMSSPETIYKRSSVGSDQFQNLPSQETVSTQDSQYQPVMRNISRLPPLYNSDEVTSSQSPLRRQRILKASSFRYNLQDQQMRALKGRIKDRSNQNVESKPPPSRNISSRVSRNQSQQKKELDYSSDEHNIYDLEPLEQDTEKERLIQIFELMKFRSETYESDVADRKPISCNEIIKQTQMYLYEKILGLLVGIKQPGQDGSVVKNTLGQILGTLPRVELMSRLTYFFPHNKFSTNFV